MSNLRLDVTNVLLLKKQIAETELIRLAGQDGVITPYNKRINSIISELEKIDQINRNIELFNRYFPEQTQQPKQPLSTQNNQTQQGVVHQGQTHGE